MTGVGINPKTGGGSDVEVFKCVHVENVVKGFWGTCSVKK